MNHSLGYWLASKGGAALYRNIRLAAYAKTRENAALLRELSNVIHHNNVLTEG